MALTVEQGAQAGSLATTALTLRTILAALQDAGAANAAIENITVTPSVGSILNANLPLSAADSALLMSTAFKVYQGMLDATVAQLNAMGG